MRTLLVEDDLVTAHSIATALEEDGYFCDIASSTSEALEFLRHTHYSVAILDYYLRSETSLFLASHIRLRHPGTKSITITGAPLFASGYGVGQLSTDFLFRKPFPMSDLVEIVRYLDQTADTHVPKGSEGVGAFTA